jgi:hypothetical protein
MPAKPTRRDLEEAARSLRLIVDKTSGLPDSTLVDARLQERLELAAAVLEAVADNR